MDPATVSSVAYQILTPLSSMTISEAVPLLLSSLDSAVMHTAFVNPLEEFEGWVRSHPLQDVALISITVFALNALKAGASLPVAIVAGSRSSNHNTLHTLSSLLPPLPALHPSSALRPLPSPLSSLLTQPSSPSSPHPSALSTLHSPPSALCPLPSGLRPLPLFLFLLHGVK